MKIGILTLPQETNYGGLLQAFALQTILCRMGHEAITIDRHNLRGYPSLGVHIISFLTRLFKHYLLGKNVTTLWKPYITEEEYRIVSVNTQDFIDRNIKLTRRVRSDQLNEIEKEYQFDAYVVGSDQVWLEYYCPNSFLDFVKRPQVKKVVYAASCGKNSFFLYESKVQVCAKLAKDFSGISVREESLLKLCKEKLDVTAQWVLDPTMLLAKEDYLSVVRMPKDHNPIVFTYILDDSVEKNKLITGIAAELKLPVVRGNVAMYYDKTKGTAINDCIFPSVDDWINNLNRASYVVTDSFHGTVFAILFNKPFVTIGNEKRGLLRLKSLLNMFGLESQLISEGETDKFESCLKKNFNFDEVNKIISIEKEKSLKFLLDSLK